MSLPKELTRLLYNGFSPWPAGSMEQILAAPPAQVRLDDLRRLSYRELVLLFHHAEAPDFQSLKGEYKAAALPVGLWGRLGGLYIRYLFGPGQWMGKGFFPFAPTAGWGYNLFSVTKGGEHQTVRCRKMATFIGPSNIDDKSSFHIDYRPYNRLLNSTAHDEVRCISETLLLGMGYLGYNAGAITPVPFVLYGEPTDWIGPDQE